MSRADRTPQLTTTSYAILGLLAIQPWTTYELAKQMERTLNRVWPRARSKLYEEPKKLVAHGFAEASDEQVGRRPRTMYSITPLGRKALRSWLQIPGGGIEIESEQLVKLFFADSASTKDARASLDALHAWSVEQLDTFAEATRAYLSGAGPFQDRAAVIIVNARFMVDFYAMVARWTEWATEQIADWPNDPKKALPAWDEMRETLRRAEEGRAASP